MKHGRCIIYLDAPIISLENENLWARFFRQFGIGLASGRGGQFVPGVALRTGRRPE